MFLWGQKVIADSNPTSLSSCGDELWRFQLGTSLGLVAGSGVAQILQWPSWGHVQAIVSHWHEIQIHSLGGMRAYHLGTIRSCLGPKRLVMAVRNFIHSCWAPIDIKQLSFSNFHKPTPLLCASFNTKVLNLNLKKHLGPAQTSLWDLPEVVDSPSQKPGDSPKPHVQLS